MKKFIGLVMTFLAKAGSAIVKFQYWSFFKKNWATFGKIAVFIVALVGFLNDGIELITNHIEQKHAEDSLDQINSGVSIKHVEAIFGAPTIENRIHKSKFTEYLYSFKKFYLQVIFDEKNTVQFFAVTSKDKDFKPIIPYIHQRIGEYKFSELDLFGVTTLSSNLSSKFYEYSEYGALGNPANYRNIYIAYNPAGIEYEKIHDFPSILDSESPLAINRFRENNYPNTFGIGAILGDEENIFEETGVGIDYYQARDLPEHHY